MNDRTRDCPACGAKAGAPCRVTYQPTLRGAKHLRLGPLGSPIPHFVHRARLDQAAEAA